MTTAMTSDAENSPQVSEKVIGGIIVVVAGVLQTQLMGFATVFLSVGLIVAYLIWSAASLSQNRTVILSIYLLGLAIQCVHFGEEYLTGFQREFPRLFGYQWNDAQFVAFNVVWLTAFILASIGVHRGIRLGYLFVVFFALAGGIGNGLGHLALCVVEKRYFPGAITAPLSLILGVALLRALFTTNERSS